MGPTRVEDTPDAWYRLWGCGQPYGQEPRISVSQLRTESQALGEMLATDALLAAIRAVWERQHWPHGITVLAAVSGGPDSVALARGLAELQQEQQWSLELAHFNHGWRGAESDADARFVQELASQLNLVCHLGHAAELGFRLNLDLDEATSASPVDGSEEAAAASEVDRPRPPRSAARSAEARSEESARIQRYRFFAEVAQRRQLAWVATGHTVNDQQETVLHHLMRGTGVSGLQGIPRQRPLGRSGATVIRPLLAVDRTTIINALAAWGQTYRQDHTNDSAAFTRNRLRNEVLPLLRDIYGATRVARSLGRLAAQAQDVADLLQPMAESILQQALQSATDLDVLLSRAELVSQPRHLLREVGVRLWHRQQWPRQAMGFDDWDRWAQLIETSGQTVLPGAISLIVDSQAIRLRQLPIL
jgi:tRNA(Ile)-lysidine synthase